MLDGEILCVHDYRFRLEMFCTLCEQAITSEYVTVDNKKYHAHCLSCKVRFFFSPSMTLMKMPL